MDSSAPGRKLSPLQPQDRIVEPRVGWVVGTTVDGSALVDFPGNVAGPLPARSSLTLEPGSLARAASDRQGAILLFENGDPSLPLLVGLLQAPSHTPLIDAALERSLEDVPKEARVDGRKVVIEGRDEVVLRCGKATLTLRRDGQVLLRGVNIRTEAEEVQRIKGGKVQIN
ncbi:DUF6484 domain-containing protein [Pyxidicoccus sp. 3LG]